MVPPDEQEDETLPPGLLEQLERVKPGFRPVTTSAARRGGPATPPSALTPDVATLRAKAAALAAPSGPGRAVPGFGTGWHARAGGPLGEDDAGGTEGPTAPDDTAGASPDTASLLRKFLGSRAASDNLGGAAPPGGGYAGGAAPEASLGATGGAPSEAARRQRIISVRPERVEDGTDDADRAVPPRELLFDDDGPLGETS